MIWPKIGWHTRRPKQKWIWEEFEPKEVSAEELEVTKIDDLSAIEESQYEHEHKRAQIQRIKDNNSLRRDLTQSLSTLVERWLGFIALIMFLQGWGWSNFNLSNELLLALVGGTTVTVTTLLIVALRYLFSKQSE